MVYIAQTVSVMLFKATVGVVERFCMIMLLGVLSLYVLCHQGRIQDFEKGGSNLPRGVRFLIFTYNFLNFPMKMK